MISAEDSYALLHLLSGLCFLNLGSPACPCALCFEIYGDRLVAHALTASSLFSFPHQPSLRKLSVEVCLVYRERCQLVALECGEQGVLSGAAPPFTSLHFALSAFSIPRYPLISQILFPRKSYPGPWDCNMAPELPKWKRCAQTQSPS